MMLKKNTKKRKINKLKALKWILIMVCFAVLLYFLRELINYIQDLIDINLALKRHINGLDGEINSLKQVIHTQSSVIDAQNIKIHNLENSLNWNNIPQLREPSVVQVPKTDLVEIDNKLLDPTMIALTGGVTVIMILKGIASLLPIIP